MTSSFGWSASTWTTKIVPYEVIDQAALSDRWLKFPNNPALVDGSVFHRPTYVKTAAAAVEDGTARVLHFSPTKDGSIANDGLFGESNNRSIVSTVSPAVSFSAVRPSGGTTSFAHFESIFEIEEQKILSILRDKELKESEVKELCDAGNLAVAAGNAEETKKCEEQWSRASIELQVISKFYDVQLQSLKDQKYAWNKARKDKLDDSIKKYTKYLDDCSRIIGRLEGLCDYQLQCKLSNCNEFQEASQLCDLVRCLFIVKSISLGGHVHNSIDNSQKILDKINSFTYTAGDFNRYCNLFLQLFNDYKFSNGVVPESHIVNILIRNVGSKFSLKTDAWVEDEQTRPKKVCECLTILEKYFSRVISLNHNNNNNTDERRDLKRKNEMEREFDVVRSFTTHSVDCPPGVCYRFWEHGECGYGQHCRFKHEPNKKSVLTTGGSNPLGMAYCSDVILNGICRRGERCTRAAAHKISGVMWKAACAEKKKKSAMHISFEVPDVTPFSVLEDDEPEQGNEDQAGGDGADEDGIENF